MKDCYIHPTLRQLLDELEANEENVKPLDSYRREAKETQRLMKVWWKDIDINEEDDS